MPAFSSKVVLWLSAFAIVFAIVLSPGHATPLEKRTGVVPSFSGGVNPIGAGTYPRTNFLKDGSIFGVYTAFSNGESVLTATRSTNGGVTWTNTGVIASGPTATTDIDNPYPLQLPSGRILVAFRNHDKANGAYTYFRITVCYSDNNGVSWSFLSEVASDPGPVNGNWEPFLRLAQDGTLQIYYSRETSADDQDSLLRTSTNGGLNWSSATVISGGELSNARDGMLGVATISGSNLIGVFETGQGGVFTINSITSSDDGKTWGNRRRVYTATGSNNNAGAPQIINVGGTLVVSFMTDEDTQLHSWINGASAKLVTSGDGGSTWGNKLQFGDVQSNWPGLMTLDGTSFLAMADHGGSFARKIVLS